jgi:hypothetical protein
VQGPALSIKPGRLTAAGDYTFRLAVGTLEDRLEAGGGSGNAGFGDAKLVVNAPPSVKAGGRPFKEPLLADFAGGSGSGGGSVSESEVKGVAAVTHFTLETQDWDEANAPVEYQFFFFPFSASPAAAAAAAAAASTTVRHWISQRQASPVLSGFTLPAGNLTVGVRAYDRSGAYGDAVLERGGSLLLPSSGESRPVRVEENVVELGANGELFASEMDSIVSATVGVALELGDPAALAAAITSTLSVVDGAVLLAEAAAGGGGGDGASARLAQVFKETRKLRGRFISKAPSTGRSSKAPSTGRSSRSQKAGAPAWWTRRRPPRLPRP